MRVLHLTGSAVSDFHADLSRLYAADAVAALTGHEHLIAHVRPDGSWSFPADLDDSTIAAAPALGVGEAVVRLGTLGVDAVVPQMFCVPGMTSYRSLIELVGLPLLGNPGEVMALGAHKGRTRAVVAAEGVAVPDAQLLRAGQQPDLTLPVVVKPADTDNSHGLTLVRTADELPAALARAFAESDEVLVERYVELGREVRCGILERDGELVGLPLEEYAVDPETKPVRDAADKLRPGRDGGLELVAKDAEHAWIVADDDPLTPAVHAAAMAAHRALGCRDYSLFDIRVDPDGRPWFLEAGLYCSFARTSVVAVMATAAGIGLGELFDGVLATALRRGSPGGFADNQTW